MINMYPTEFEAREADDLLFKVQCFDDACSTVDIKTVVTPELWLEMSAHIYKALLAIHKKEETK